MYNKNRAVKARGASRMLPNKSKVDFVPTVSSTRRLEQASQAGHVRSDNNIMRFERKKHL